MTEQEFNFNIGCKIQHKDKDDKTKQHKYPHDKTYLFLGFSRLKSPESGKWYDACRYREIISDDTNAQGYRHDGPEFDREKNSFIEEFKEVK